MKIGIILQTKEAEKAWNALRFANAARSKEHEVRLFLLGEAVEIEQLEAEPYNVAAEIEAFRAEGGSILACGTCLIARHLENSTSCSFSTMLDCLDVVEWSERLLTF